MRDNYKLQRPINPRSKALIYNTDNFEKIEEEDAYGLDKRKTLFLL